MTILKLNTAIEAHGATVTQLHFREPTGGDIEECGLPVQVANEGKNASTRIDAAVVGLLIAKLADIPPSSVKKLSVRDWTAAMGIVIDFFGAPTPES